MDANKLRLHRDTLRVLAADLQARVERGDRLLTALRKELEDTHLDLWHTEDELALTESVEEEPVPIIIGNEDEIPF